MDYKTGWLLNQLHENARFGLFGDILSTRRRDSLLFCSLSVFFWEKGYVNVIDYNPERDRSTDLICDMSHAHFAIETCEKWMMDH